MLVAAGDGATTLYTFNFAGGYIAKADVKGYIYNPATGTSTMLTITAGMWQTDSQIKLASPVPTGQYIVLYRDTQKSAPLVDFTNGAVLNEQNLDKMAQQSIFVAAEMADRFDLLNDGSVLAIANSATALSTANTALANSATAITTANAATASAAGAVSTANTAKTTADASKITADTAKATADGIDAKATSALSNASAAVTTANGIDAKASTALTNANTAVTTANTAKTTADTAKATADGVDAKAQTALDTANTAKASADNAYQKSGGDVSGAIVSTFADSFRIISGNYGTYWRNDASNLYLMSTASGNQRGSYNTYRPITYSLSTGLLTLADSNHGLDIGSTTTLKNQNTTYSFPLRFNAGGYQPFMRANSVASTLEAVNSANTAVNFSIFDNGNASARGALYAGAATFNTDGNVYGTVWGGWLSSWLTSQLSGKMNVFNYVWGRDGSNGRYSFSWDGKVRAWVDGTHQGAIWTDAFIQCNGANGKMNFDSCQQLGYANGNRDLPYLMNNGTYSWLVTQKNGSNTVNLPVRANGYIEWTTDIGSVGCNYFTSDEFYKQNIQPVDKTFMDDVERMEFVSFDYKPNYNSGEHWKLGVTSQQLESIDPDYVHTLSDQTKTPDTSRLLILALRTIQELNDRVKALEAVNR
jgi:hypothetical protein